MMPAVSRSVKVTVAGQTFKVRTDAKPKYVKDLAAFVTERMEEVRKSSRIATTQSLALLAAISIADDLYQEREARSQLKKEVRERSKRILRHLEKGAET
jgi:cell division protein ZapA